MEKIHKLELFIVELNDCHGIDNIIESIDQGLNGHSSALVNVIKTESKDIIWSDDILLNNTDDIKEWTQFFDNIENDEYQTYLKLKEKYDD